MLQETSVRVETGEREEQEELRLQILMILIVLSVAERQKAGDVKYQNILISAPFAVDNEPF